MVFVSEGSDFVLKYGILWIKLLVIVILLNFCSAFAEETAPLRGWYPTIDVGVRSLGMGSAFTAVADDVSGLLLNPANLEQVQLNKIEIMNTNVLNAGIQYTFLAGRFNIPVIGSTGISYTRLDASSVLNFKYQEAAIVLTKSKEVNLPILGNTSIGVNLKLLPVRIESADVSAKADGFGADLGILWKKENFQLGLKVADPFTVVKVTKSVIGEAKDQLQERIVPQFNYGVAYFPSSKMIIAVDDTRKNGKNILNLGLEYNVHQRLSWRVGINDGNLTVGFSIGTGKYQINYAYKHGLIDDNHRFSIGYQL